MIELNIKKSLDNIKLDINTTIKEHDFIALFGKSGSGKTTLLRILAGLEKSQSIIKVDSEIWQDKNTFLPPQKRQIGFVFQEYALFENMSILDNLLYVKDDEKLANQLLDIIELSHLKSRFPNTLSGGQSQRVALVRAMMNRPKLLLMDEPLSALDDEMRLKLQNEILLLHKKFKTTTIFVSHDKSEVYKLSNRIIEIDDGKIINDMHSKDIYISHPKDNEKFLFEAEVLEVDGEISKVLISNQMIEVDTAKYDINHIGQKIDIEW